jgi:hypothetical protein
MLPANARHKRLTGPLVQSAPIEIARLGYPRGNAPNLLDHGIRAIIGREIGIRLFVPGKYAELRITCQEARDLASGLINSLPKFEDQAERVIDQACANFRRACEVVEIDAERYAQDLLSLPVARKTPKWTLRDFHVPLFLHRAADHLVDDEDLLRGLARDLSFVILNELGGPTAAKTECQRFLSEYADRFGVARCQQVSRVLANLPDGVSDSISSGESMSELVTYRSSLHELLWDKGARRKFSSDLDLTLRIFLARDALWYAGHSRPLSFIAEQLNGHFRSGRHQGWTVQDVESRLKSFRDQLVPEAEQTWPAFAARWLEKTDVGKHKRAFEVYLRGGEVRFCFKVAGSTGRGKRKRRTPIPPQGLIVDSKSEVTNCLWERGWRPPDGATRLEWFGACLLDWILLSAEVASVSDR